MSDMSPTQDRLLLGDALVRRVVQEFGSPIYVVSEAHFRARVRRYREAFAAVYPKTELTYASKANSTLAILKMANQEGCRIDVASEGELQAAMAAGIKPKECHLHGNNKTRREINFAIEMGISQIVADNFEELETLAEAIQPDSKTTVLLRLAPGVDPKTHKKISTGQDDTKFGFNVADGSAERALKRCLELRLPVVGFHCHVGSQLDDPEAQRVGGQTLARFAVQMLRQYAFRTEVINVGGGLGVRYQGEQPMPVEDYCRLIVQSITNALEASGLEPTLVQEPGRSLIAEAGVTLYTVGVRKTVPSPSIGQRTYLAVNGGLADNPRPALYGARYEVHATPGNTRSLSQESQPFTIASRHCESDTLFEDVTLPNDLRPGDILQVLCTGAYNSSMASNYNRYPRPTTVLLRQDGRMQSVQRPETWEEMFARESVPNDL